MRSRVPEGSLCKAELPTHPPLMSRVPALKRPPPPSVPPISDPKVTVKGIVRGPEARLAQKGAVVPSRHRLSAGPGHAYCRGIVLFHS